MGGVVLALLALRLVRADTAFEDEATYLWAGHLEWAHWLHGASIPPFPAYFSGAPFLYPPLGALADSIGGLTAARVLSLIFMLGATALLWDTTRRLFGARAAFFAAALFAVLGPTLHLAAFATYDALAVLFMGLAAWLVVRARQQQGATGWMIAAAVALALAVAAPGARTRVRDGDGDVFSTTQPSAARPCRVFSGTPVSSRRVPTPACGAPVGSEEPS